MKLRAIEARGEGVPVKRIAEECEVSETTVIRWTTPGYAEKVAEYKRKWAKRNRAKQRGYEEKTLLKNRCRGCRKPGRYKDGALCARCQAEDRNFRRIDIQRLWNEEKLKPAEIAEIVGTTKNYVEKEVIAMRREGWDVHRRAAPRK